MWVSLWVSNVLIWLVGRWVSRVKGSYIIGCSVCVVKGDMICWVRCIEM